MTGRKLPRITTRLTLTLIFGLPRHAVPMLPTSVSPLLAFVVGIASHSTSTAGHSRYVLANRLFGHLILWLFSFIGSRAVLWSLHFFRNGYFKVDEFEEAEEMMFHVVLQCAEDGCRYRNDFQARGAWGRDLVVPK